MSRRFFFEIISFVSISLSVLVLATTTVLAARPLKAVSTSLGNDVSWPQCDKPLPSSQAFGIVGVNSGLANNTNPCLQRELNWAVLSRGGTGQPTLALYVNTANPGLGGAWWPSNNQYAGITVNNPYGTCEGKDTPACAFMYGYAKAYDDANSRGIANPSSYTWWLDVETINSWETNTVANAADLEGMTAYFQSIGATVGLYSTASQWHKIAGTVKADSNLNGLQSWLAGASSETGARNMCDNLPLTAGGSVTLTQFISRGLDYDHSCI